MVLGILSDTHNHVDALSAGLDVLRRHGAEFYIHCGDIGEERALDRLAGLPCAAVWGNTDFDRGRLGGYARSIGVTIHEPYARLQFEGKVVIVTHGDDGSIMRQAIQHRWGDYLLYGHTHVPADDRRDGVRIINPGALHRARPKTVATLDLGADLLTHHEIRA